MLNRIRRYRSISIGIAALLLFSVVGMHLDVHYCQGSFAGVSLLSPETSSCDMQQVDATGDCCVSSEHDKSCCEDVESISSLDYDGLVHTGIQLDDDSSLSLLFSLSSSIFKPIEIPEVDNLKIDPPDELSLNGAQRRIRYQSFLC